ncbi:hypothetical protein JHK85_049210 [Glycine max]|nr:hypothetical protein JHK86_048562 [Glycine max]KAG4944564.1 hypothetical protein JHK85_049210 [Glycine max]
MLQGLKLVCESGLKDVICEIDSMELIRLIAQDNSHFHPYAAIKEFKVHSWNILFSHTLREGNSCANLLPKIGVEIQKRASSLLTETKACV